MYLTCRRGRQVLPLFYIHIEYESGILKDDYSEWLSAQYLKGEELPVSANINGYVGICVDGVVTGYAKAVGGRLKNKYPKGLRLL